jgi:hypothetical protein
MLVEEVVGGGHVFVETVCTRPGVADEAEKEVVFPDACNLLRCVETLPGGLVVVVAAARTL